jgi:hypothetical protein
MAVNDLIILRKGTATQWSSADPVLSSGEPGYDITNNLLKIGNGSTSWSSLSGVNIGNSTFNSAVSGLLPVKSLVAGTGIYISSSSGAYTINSTVTAGGGGGGSATNVANYADNRLLTSDGTSTGINAESSLTFDGNTFAVNPTGATSSSFIVNSTGIFCGKNASVYNSGQVSISNGKFSTDGDAQFSQYVLRTQTSNNSWTSLQSDGASGVLLKPNKTYSFCATIVGRCTSQSNNAAYKLEGLVVNDTNSPSIIGTPIKTTLGETDSSWDARALISGVYLLCQVQGATSQNINWVGSVSLVENGGLLTGAYIQSFSNKDIIVEWT